MKLYRSYSIRICYGSSANQARDRLDWITRRDRAACGDGRWVRVAARKPLSIPDPMDDSGFDDWMREVAEWLPPVYRWEPRR